MFLDTYLVYNRTMCSNALSCALVLYESNGTDTNKHHGVVYYFIYFACAFAFFHVSSLSRVNRTGIDLFFAAWGSALSSVIETAQ